MENRALLVAVLFVGATTLLLLVADAVTGSLAARSVRDEDDLEFLTRTRVRDVVWAVAVTAVIATLCAFTVDTVIRSGAYVHGNLSAVLALLVATWAGTFAIGAVGALAAIRRERPSYARIRRDLRDRPVLTMTPDEQSDYTERLAQADRARGRRWHASGALRVLGIAVVLAVATGTIVSTGARVEWTATVLVGAAIGIAAVVVAARAARVRAAALDQLLGEQRAEVRFLLDRARIPRAGTTPGLARRVADALAILREQQK